MSWLNFEYRDRTKNRFSGQSAPQCFPCITSCKYVTWCSDSKYLQVRIHVPTARASPGLNMGFRSFDKGLNSYTNRYYAEMAFSWWTDSGPRLYFGRVKLFNNLKSRAIPNAILL